MIRLPPRSTRTDTLFPYTTLFRSAYSSQSWGDKSLHRRAASIPTMRQTPQLPALRGLSPDLETRLPQHPASRRPRPGVGEAGRLTPAGAARNRITLRCSEEERRVGKEYVSRIRDRWAPKP